MREEFTAALETHILADVRRRNLATAQANRAPWSTARAAAALLMVGLVSAAVGGGVVAASYERQAAQVRNELVALAQNNLTLAEQKLEAATREDAFERRKFDVGMADSASVLQKGVDVALAKAEVDKLRLNLEEVKLSGREPRSELSAPLVGGRDFVRERLAAERSVPAAIEALEEKLVADIRIRIEIGTLAPLEANLARVRLVDAGSLKRLVERRIQIRDLTVAGSMSGAEADLRGLEAEAEHRVRSFTAKVEAARVDVGRVTQATGAGAAGLVDTAEAKLTLATAEADLRKAELDLLLIQRRIAGLKK